MENTERKENLDEKEKLAEAGQQRQKAPQDTVVHIAELWRKCGGGDGGRNPELAEGEREREPQRKGWKLVSEIQRVEAGRKRKGRKIGVENISSETETKETELKYPTVLAKRV